MKKTVIVTPNSFQQSAIEALMKELNFTEVERVVTGGHMSSTELVITFEGDEKDYHEKSYVRQPTQSPTGRTYFYSLGLIGGHFGETVEEFVKVLQGNAIDVEVKKLPS